MYTNPTPEQLDKINQYTPANMEPLEASEVAVVKFSATDNLLNRGLAKWGVEELPAIAALLPGLPLMLDHDWEDVSGNQGLMFEAMVEKSDIAPEWAINRAGNATANRQVVAEEGFSQVIVNCALPTTSPALQSLRFGSIGAVSLGGFVFKKFVCPLCKISFEDEDCPHHLPDPWWGLTAEKDIRVAPYYIRTGVYDLGELSLVSIPKVPAAGVVTRQKLGVSS